MSKEEIEDRSLRGMVARIEKVYICKIECYLRRIFVTLLQSLLVNLAATSVGNQNRLSA